MSATYLASEDGNYKVAVTNEFGCPGESEELSVVVTGLDDAPANKHVTIYPNPVTGSLTIESLHIPLSDFRLYNMDGKLLLQESRLSGYTHSLDLFSSQQGVYLVELLAAGKVYRERLVLVR